MADSEEIVKIDRRSLLAAGTLGLAGMLALPGCLRNPGAVGTAAADSDTILLFTFFTGPDEGREGLKLATSEDGFVFTQLGNGKGFLQPRVGENKLMRDPALTQGPDGLWHLVWTTDWFGNVIGHASSPDLRNWSEQQAIPVMKAFPGTRNCWAPEAVWDPAAGHFVIVWSSSVVGRFGATQGTRFDGLNHRPYFTTTRDFRTFSPTRLLFDPGFNAIDFTFLRLANGGWRLIYKDETPAGEGKARWMVSASAETPTGPFGPASTPFTQSMTEGPTAIRLGDRYIVYYDVYTKRHFGAKTTQDFVTWTDVTPMIRFPEHARHGTVVRVPRRLVQDLI